MNFREYLIVPGCQHSARVVLQAFVLDDFSVWELAKPSSCKIIDLFHGAFSILRIEADISIYNVSILHFSAVRVVELVFIFFVSVDDLPSSRTAHSFKT